MFNVLKALMLLALLAVCGEAAAMHCDREQAHQQESAHDKLAHDQEIAHKPSSSADQHAATPNRSSQGLRAASTSQSASTCSNGQCEDAHTASAPHRDCDGSCSCCPGHCANAIPASAMVAEFASFTRSTTAYRPLNSNPAPEATIRPPISA